MDQSRDGKKKERGSGWKYSVALKHLIPVRPSPKKKDVLPTRYTGAVGYSSVSWLTPLMWKAYRSKIDPEDVWKISAEEETERNTDRLQTFWSEELARAKKSARKPKLFNAVWRFCQTRLILCIIFGLTLEVTFFMGPMVFLRLILDYINSPDIDHVYGAYLLAGLVVIGIIFPSVINNTMFINGTHTSSRLTLALQAIIYKKLLTLKTGGENLAAKVINFSSNDMERIFEACLCCVFMIEIPLAFFLCLGYCLFLIGPWSLLGFLVYLLFYPSMALIAKIQNVIREKTIKQTDKRVALMSEILNSMKLIKMYAWEEPFAKKIAEIRKSEMKMLRLGALCSSVTNTMTPAVGILATIVSILAFTLAGNAITATEAFVLLNIFYGMQYTVSFLPYIVKCFAEANISLRRMQKVLMLPEHKSTSAGEDSAVYAIQIQAADFLWETIDIDKEEEAAEKKSKQKPTTTTNERQASTAAGEREVREENSKEQLKSLTGAVSEQELENDKSIVTLFEITLSVPHGKLVGVCGCIGSGKSSLISAICGDMLKDCGSMFINGQVALVTQQAWIYNETLRDNILLGSDYQEEKYLKAIHYSCLESDLEMFPAGDLSEIGEKGINLSGGQKQRVNLARALYSDRDIYLLDDPLSAVDTKVANNIFYNCIKGHLKDKTVLLVTHALHLLEQCDEIIVMHEGKITEYGPHGQLLEQRGDYYRMVGIDDNPEKLQPLKTKLNHQLSVENSTSKEKTTDSEEGDKQDGKLTTEEEKGSGSVGKRVYQTFIKVCGGWTVALCLLMSVILFAFIQLLNTVWLKVWLDEGDGHVKDRQQNVTLYNLTLTEDEIKGSIIHNPLLWMYQTVYGVSFIAFIVVGIGKGVGITFSALMGASRLHNDMFSSILRSPMSFFDSTPSGRILNRFSRDLDETDVRIPYFLEFVLQGILTSIGQVILVAFIYIWFVIPLIIITVLFVLVDIFLNAGIREIKRIDNIRKSPVLQHIGSSLAGLSVIRTFDRQEHFTKRMYQYLDDHAVAQLMFKLSSRWYVFRTEMLSLAINVSVCALCIFTKGLVSTATAGLALSTTSAVCEFFPYLMKMKAEFHSRFTAVERLAEYSYDLTSEAPQKDPGRPAPREWPEYGRVEIKKVCLRYRPDLPLILHDIEATFNPGQKIGIVGRTGAGKSSLITTLLRLVEVESGSVLIDGVDIATLGLHTLRSAISVIPQDPILFQGTIRYNLDPFNEHSDTAIWEALEQSNLKRVMNEQDRSLQSQVSTAGENFSVGERQLICLTRALLRKSKILLLDEATASVDLETDQTIQTTIRKAFSESTVITIAHRLNTVTTYDRILVLREGRVVEFDTPVSLMTTEGSLFREMMAAMGVTTIEQMKALT